LNRGKAAGSQQGEYRKLPAKSIQKNLLPLGHSLYL
jgi:hypothetical protein